MAWDDWKLVIPFLILQMLAFRVRLINLKSTLCQVLNADLLRLIYTYEMDTNKVEGSRVRRLVQPMEHHKQLSLCETRPAYRQGRKLTAVKVYTINDESQHLLIFGVPSINLMENVKRTCSKYGAVKSVKLVSNYPDIEEFTQVYHVHYLKIASARFAKKKLDATSFFGGVLHVCYAPELESVDETREKLITRRKQVHFKLEFLKLEKGKTTEEMTS